MDGDYLKQIVEELKQIQAAELQNLKSRAELQFRTAEKNFIEIETDVEENENFLPLQVEDSIFFQMKSPDDELKTFPYGPFFLRVPYEEFQNFLHKDYFGKDFKYKLVPNCRFVEAEEKIFRIATIYNAPVQIYSPYARRAVDICIAEKSAADFTKLADLDFQLEKNNLADKLLLNNKFYWNVQIKPVETSWDKQDGDIYEYGFENQFDSQIYILPETDSRFDDEIEALKSEGQIILKSPRELPNEFVAVKILTAESKIAPRILSKNRLRTKGDIEFILSGLAWKNFHCSFGNFGGSAKKILRYSKEHKYPTSQDENLLRAKIKLPVCTVKFFGEGIFLTDYANYVIHFLEEYFPEFNWAGEYVE